MKNLFNLPLLKAATYIALLYSVFALDSCSKSDLMPNNQERQSAFSSKDATTIAGIMAFKDYKSLFQYTNVVGSKSKSDRLNIEAKNNFVSLSSLYDDLNEGIAQKSTLPVSLVKETNGQYEYTPGAMFFAAVANKDGYFITGQVLNQVSNTYVKSINLSDFSPDALQQAINKLDKHEKNGVGKEVTITNFIIKNLMASNKPNARVSPGYYSTESPRDDQGIPDGYQYSAKIVLQYIGYVYTPTYCDGEYVYDEYGNLQCNGTLTTDTPRSYARIYGTVQGLSDGNTQYDYNHTISTYVNCNLNLYIPGTGVVPINASQSANGHILNYTFYNAESSSYDNSAPYLEGYVQFSATHRIVYNGPVSTPFTTSGHLRF